METSQSIANIAKDLVLAQTKMGNALKDAKNPFYKSTYADINSVREACLPALNENNICVLQPMVTIEGKNYIKTVLLHGSGEYIAGVTEIIFGKNGDAQAQGSGTTYARRYGLSSILNLGTEDDDGNGASKKEDKAEPKAEPKKQLPEPPKTEPPTKTILTQQSPQFDSVKLKLSNGEVDMDTVEKHFIISDAIKTALTQ